MSRAGRGVGAVAEIGRSESDGYSSVDGRRRWARAVERSGVAVGQWSHDFPHGLGQDVGLALAER